jgi:hypothetical protein
MQLVYQSMLQESGLEKFLSERAFWFSYLFSFVVMRASSTVSKTISLFDILPRMRDKKMPNAKPAAKPIDATATILLLIVKFISPTWVISALC